MVGLLLLLLFNCVLSLESNSFRVLDVAEDPCSPLSWKAEPLSVSDDVSRRNVTCGEERPKTDFAKQPIVDFADVDQTKQYLLLMVDPDAPGHTRGEYFLHWLAENIPGNVFDGTKIDSRYDVEGAGYYPPGPPRNTGLHRYIFLLFEQLEALRIPRIEGRRKFNLENFVDSMGSKVKPVPSAISMFKSEF